MTPDPSTGSTTMTSEQRAEAMAWLSRQSRTAGGHYATLAAMLAEPRMPEEPTPELIDAMYRGYWNGQSNPETRWLDSYRALRAYLLTHGREDVAAAAREPDLQQRLDRIEARQLVLYGELHGVLPPEGQRWLISQWNAVTASKGE